MLSRQTRTVLQASALGLGLGFTTACAAQPRRAATASPAYRAAVRSASRARVIADGVEVRATLWTNALLRSAPNFGSDHADEAWPDRYREGVSFTVEVWLADRPQRGTGELEPLATPGAWSFRMDRDNARGRRPTTVDILAVDRFPAAGRGHHHRLVFAVHFADVANTAVQRTRLYLRTNAAPPGHGPELGPRVARHGAALTWRGKHR